jgi:hypothetical protein
VFLHVLVWAAQGLKGDNTDDEARARQLRKLNVMQSDADDYAEVIAWLTSLAV